MKRTHYSLPNALLIVFVFILLVHLFNVEGSSSTLKLSPDSGLSYDEEYKLFMAEEEEDESSHLSRQKRFIYLNVDTFMSVAFLLGVPLSFVLPSMTNLFNSWRRKRSIDESGSTAWMAQDASPEMEKVNTYFQLLDIPEPSCQVRAICEFSAEPEKYYPLSDVILKRVRNPDLPSLAYREVGTDSASSNSSHLATGNSEKKSLYELYNQAADEGEMHGFERCNDRFSDSCHYPIEKLLNMPVIKFWSALQTLLRLSFKDTSLKT